MIQSWLVPSLGALERAAPERTLHVAIADTPDLAVRLGYAGVEHSLVHDTVKAIEACPLGHVEVIANYTAFLQLQRAVEKHHG